jgi:hypothetical protein
MPAGGIKPPAFGAVGDHKLGLRLRLDVSGEPGAAGADYSALAQFLAEQS